MKSISSTSFFVYAGWVTSSQTASMLRLVRVFAAGICDAYQNSVNYCPFVVFEIMSVYFYRFGQERQRFQISSTQMLQPIGQNMHRITIIKSNMMEFGL